MPSACTQGMAYAPGTRTSFVTIYVPFNVYWVGPRCRCRSQHHIIHACALVWVCELTPRKSQCTHELKRERERHLRPALLYCNPLPPQGGSGHSRVIQARDVSLDLGTGSSYFSKRRREPSRALLDLQHLYREEQCGLRRAAQPCMSRARPHMTCGIVTCSSKAEGRCGVL